VPQPPFRELQRVMGSPLSLLFSRLTRPGCCPTGSKRVVPVQWEGVKKKQLLAQEPLLTKQKTRVCWAALSCAFCPAAGLAGPKGTQVVQQSLRSSAGPWGAAGGRGWQGSVSFSCGTFIRAYPCSSKPPALAFVCGQLCLGKQCITGFVILCHFPCLFWH